KIPVGPISQIKMPNIPVGPISQIKMPNIPVGPISQIKMPNIPVGPISQIKMPKIPMGPGGQIKMPNIPTGPISQIKMPGLKMPALGGGHGAGHGGGIPKINMPNVNISPGHVRGPSVNIGMPHHPHPSTHQNIYFLNSQINAATRTPPPPGRTGQYPPPTGQGMATAPPRPNVPQLMFQARNEIMQGNIQKARDLYEEVLKLDPSNVEAKRLKDNI
ncbi:MAG: hypothetical protein ACTSRA_22885, partial [Promethearchaeota archaeon]